MSKIKPTPSRQNGTPLQGGESKTCKVYHADFYGLRDEKYYRCLNEELKTINWTEVDATSPFYLFKYQNKGIKQKYEKYHKVDELFNKSGVGVATSRDDLTVHFERKDLLKTLKRFIALNENDARVIFHLGSDSTDWKIALAQQDIKITGIVENKIINYLYRPFDIRYTYYTGKVKGFQSRPRKDIMKHLLRDNISLYVGRQGQAAGNESWNLIFVGKFVEDYNLFRRGNNACFPLYIYEDVKEGTLFDEKHASDDKKVDNFSPFFKNYLTDKYNNQFTPEEVVSYIYAILHSPSYRKKYHEFLKIDFPRIPFTDEKKTFEKLSKFGWELVQAHLMNKDFLDSGWSLPRSGRSGNDTKGLGVYSGDGDNTVIKPIYEKDRKTKLYRIKINPTQYFENVPEEIYNFHIGGYQVLDKYLKDRKGRNLTLDEIENVENIVKVLKFTIEQMKEIDKLTKGWI